MKKKFFPFIIFCFKHFQIIMFLFIMLIKKTIEIECEKSSPILLTSDNQCHLIYCTEEEFREEKCIINNPIIKTQWLTKIIYGYSYFSFLQFTLSSKNELYLHSTSSSSKANCFFGLKSNGRPYFFVNGALSLFSCIIYQDSSLSPRNNGEIKSIIINDNNKKEYLMTIGKDDKNVELFDFENKELIVLSSSKEMTNFIICSNNFALLNYTENNVPYYILSFVGKDLEEINYYYVIQKYVFSYNSTEEFIDNTKIESKKILNFEDDNYKKSLSCYQTKKKL